MSELLKQQKMLATRALFGELSDLQVAELFASLKGHDDRAVQALTVSETSFLKHIIANRKWLITSFLDIYNSKGPAIVYITDDYQVIFEGSPEHEARKAKSATKAPRTIPVGNIKQHDKRKELVQQLFRGLTDSGVDKLFETLDRFKVRSLQEIAIETNIYLQYAVDKNPSLVGKVMDIYNGELEKHKDAPSKPEDTDDNLSFADLLKKEAHWYAGVKTEEARVKLQETINKVLRSVADIKPPVK